MKIQNLRTYVTKKYNQILKTPKYCVIDKCKARCCSSAPLPISLINSTKQDKFIRPIQMAISAPDCNPYCHEAIIPITKPLEKLIKLTDKTHNGKKVLELDIRKVLNAEDNYCTFLTEQGRCNIYESRPPICQDFGKPGWFKCDEMLNLKELIKLKFNTIKKLFINKQ